MGHRRQEFGKEGKAISLKLTILTLSAWATLSSQVFAADLTTGLLGQLPCATAEGYLISYEIDRLGTPNVAATSWILNTPHNISADIARRQHGEDRPFTWGESFFDLIVGNYEFNPSHRNWAGSDLSGGSRISPGGIGNVNIRCIDHIDCISEKHDIEYWLAVNFHASCQVTLHIIDTHLHFTVASLGAANIEVVGEIFGLASPEERRLLDAIMP